jgi:hypothetical protein
LPNFYISVLDNLGIDSNVDEWRIEYWKLSWQGWVQCVHVVQATWETEARGSLEPRISRST